MVGKVSVEISLVVVISVSFVVELRSGMCDRTALDTDVTVGMLAGVWIGVLAGTLMGGVFDIGGDLLAGMEVST